MGQTRVQEWTSTWARWLAALVPSFIILFLPAIARAQSVNLNANGWRVVQIVENSPCYNKANQTLVSNCSTNVCGQQFVVNGAGNWSVPGLGINSATLDIDSQAAINQVLNSIDTLGSLCGTGAGDGILATGGSTSVQNAQVENLAKIQGHKGSGAPDYSGGGVLEASSGTYGGSIPLSYGVPLSKDTAFSAVGFVSYANQGGITNQGAVSGSPAYAWQLKDGDGNHVLGIAAYVPLSLAVASVQGAPNAITVWGAGAGAIATGTLNYRAMQITYGGGAAFRVVTNGGFALPLSLLARADEPLEIISPLLTGFVSVSYANDYLNSGTEVWVLGTGASFGKYEFGYRGYYGTSSVAHTLGFSIRKELIGAEVLEREIPSEEEKKPTAPTIPTGPTIKFPGLPPLPPPPEVPKIAPECTTDSDCPGDEICEEARCMSPL